MEERRITKCEIGQGQFGSVFKCYKLLLEPEGEERCETNPYAVKCVMSNDEDCIERHETEFKIIEKLNHPNVVKGMAIFKNDMKEEVYQVMSLAEGVELFE